MPQSGLCDKETIDSQGMMESKQPGIKKVQKERAVTVVICNQSICTKKDKYGKSAESFKAILIERSKVLAQKE